MHAHPHLVAHRCRAGHRGFTLVELMIVVIVIGLLAAVALPSFIDSMRKSRRSDAFAAIAAVQQAQERWRSSHASYATELGNTSETVEPNGLRLTGTSSSGYYTLALSSVSSTSYTVTATAVSGKSQAQDGNCKLLAVRMQGGNPSYGSGASSADWADPGKCWAK